MSNFIKKAAMGQANVRRPALPRSRAGGGPSTEGWADPSSFAPPTALQKHLRQHAGAFAPQDPLYNERADER